MSEKMNVPDEVETGNGPDGESHGNIRAIVPAAYGNSRTVFEAIVFTDIEGSVRLEQKLGTKAYAAVLQRHGELFQEAICPSLTAKVEKHTGDGFMVRFSCPSEAVTAALRFQWLLRNENWNMRHPLRVRIGIHQGEIMLLDPQPQMPSAVGGPVNLAARVLSLAQGGQVLLTRGVFDNARQFVREIPDIPSSSQAELSWQAHGAYLLKGIEEPVEIFEVGESGFAPFMPPEGGSNATRSVSAEEEATLGWRPAKSREIPKRPGWFLQERVGEGGFGEVWLAQNRRTAEKRVFKFCFDVLRLRSFKRELLLFRLIREALGPRRDIVTLYEVQIETPPFFLESEYCSGGTLSQWFHAASAKGEVPLKQRLEIVARIARALAAAHSLGIIHKDVKPSNIFIEELENSEVRPRLADFGIGVLIDPTTAADFHLTMSGGLTLAAESSRTGTRMYSAPEYMINRPPSVQGDIYSLGVLFFQILTGDFERPLGLGWQRDIDDPLLLEDIAKCVDVDPQRRFSSALQLAVQIDTLEERRAAAKTAAEAARREEAQRIQIESFRRRLRVGLIGGAVAIALISALSIVAFVLHRSEKDAREHAKQLKIQSELAEERAYVADMQTATVDLAQRRGEMTRGIIDRYRPKPGQRDLRGWEWFFVDSVLNTRGLSMVASKAPLRAMAVSADDKHVAVGGDDGEVSIWTVDKLQKVITWRPGSGGIRALSWHKSGNLAIGLANGDVSIVGSPLTATETGRWRAHPGGVNVLDWHPHRDELASGGADGVIRYWSAAGQSLRNGVRKEPPINGLAWAPEGNEVAVLHGDPLKIVVAPPGQLDAGQPTSLDLDESPLAWRPGGVEVAVAMPDWPMRSFNPHAGGDSFRVPGHFSAGSTAFTWSPNGDGLAIGGVDGKITIVDVNRLKEPRIEFYGHKGHVAGLRWLGDKKPRLVSIGHDGTLRKWSDLWQSPEILSIPVPKNVADSQWHPSENKLAVLVAGDEVQIFGEDLAYPLATWVLPPPRGSRTNFRKSKIAWSPDGRWLVALSPGRSPVAWQTEDGAMRLLPLTGNETDVQWMSDSRRLLVRGEDGWAWCEVDGTESYEIAGTQKVHWMAGLEGDQIGVVSRVGTELRFGRRSWESEKLLMEVVLPETLGNISCAVLNRDRTLLALGGESGAVAWMNTHTGRTSKPPITHAGRVGALGWSPDSSRLASVGRDAQCRIFNVAQATQTWMIGEQSQGDEMAMATGWSADGTRLLFACGGEKLVKICDATRSIELERGITRDAPPGMNDELTQVLAAIRRNPNDEDGWQQLAEQLREARVDTSKPEASLLVAAVDLGAKGGFSTTRDVPVVSDSILNVWNGAALPAAVQVAQACVLRQWSEVLRLSREQRGEPWFMLAEAEALMQLGQRDAAEAANLNAWNELRRRHGSQDEGIPVTSPSSAPDGTVDISQWANIRLEESWSGGDNNSLASLDPILHQPDGIVFHCGDFLQLASKGFRISGRRMLPRSTGWMPFQKPARKVAVLATATQINPAHYLEDVVVGSIYYLRSSGRGAVRIPLVYGRNVWDWWSPAAGHVSDAPPEAIAWRGENQHASNNQKTLALFRIGWEDDGEPVIAASVISHMRMPAPTIMAISTGQ
jgi:class 3 adenylate cyclase/WD40 repeat protein